ncbi:MAG: mechanosensitive ion channel family protein [Hymenobacteraceae bacterium]|nr:mechanosensitive ion channel family protein [Hymenobacteraceae bacterium]
MPSYNRNSNSRYTTRSSRHSSSSTYGSTRTSSRQGSDTPGRTTYRGKRVNPRHQKRRAARGTAVKSAQNRLKNFRQASILAVAITGFMMLVFAPSEAGLAQDNGITQDTATVDSVAVVEEVAVEDLVAPETAEADTAATLSSKESADEAITALQGLWDNFLYNLPKMLIAIATLVLAWLLARLLRMLLNKALGRWQRSSAIISLVMIALWLFAIGVAISVVAGDIRALLGSLGLVGLALSWSLQTPIESFTGWLLNSFQGYYRVGDRVRVGEVFGDVYRIDFLTTTVWEIGSPFQPGFVQAEQPTGRMVTFPNNEILSGTVTNLTGDFPFLWDELAVAIANESDIQLSMKVMERVAQDLLGNYMEAPAKKYAVILRRAGLDDHVPEKPQVFISLEDSWTNVTIRYLVGARERRKWKSELTYRITQELGKPEYLEKIIPVYPRQQVQFIDPDGVPRDLQLLQDPQDNNNA